MNYDKFNFFLRGADYLYFKNKKVFEREQVAGNSYVLNKTHIELHPLDFKNACENPLYSPTPTLLGFALGFLHPFQYRLYKELFLYTIVFVCLNVLMTQVFSVYSTLFFYFSFLCYYLFFTFYSKTLWARKLQIYLQSHPEATKAQILRRFRPHHLLTTLTLGFVYIYLIFMSSFSLVSLYFKFFII